VPIGDDRLGVRTAPLWALVLAGAVGARAGLGLLATVAPPPPDEAPVDPAEVLRHGPARALRTLPGLGEGRARALVEARWRRAPADPPLLLRDLPGIGPAVEAALGERSGPNGAAPTDSP